MFSEDPLPILLTGLAIEAILLVILFQTQRGMILAGMVLIAVLMGGLLLVERMIVTEREKVENVLYGIADALSPDDIPTVVSHISPNMPGARAKAESALAMFKVETAKIGSDLKIKVNELTSPPSASATFTGRLEVVTRRGSIKHNAVRRFTMIFNREGDQWFLADFEHEDF